MIETLLTVYRNDSDAGLHAVAEWLLRKWHQGDKLVAIDIELRKNEEQLVAAKGDRRQWYVNGQGQTFVILDAGEFQMGSPESEVTRGWNEQLHRRKIGRRFAISTKEVTKGQWRIFAKSQKEKVSATDQGQLDRPMVMRTWYQAVRYCNWLSEQEGIP